VAVTGTLRDAGKRSRIELRLHDLDHLLTIAAPPDL
jgi:hypothetical protein